MAKKRSKIIPEFKIAKINYRPGDTLCLSAKGEMTLLTAERLKKHLEQALPGARIVVLSNGLKLSIIHKADAA